MPLNADQLNVILSSISKVIEALTKLKAEIDKAKKDLPPSQKVNQ